MVEDGQVRLHSSHWGAFQARLADGRLSEISPFPGDPAPSPQLANIAASLTHPARLARPLVRRGWLENGPGPDDRRGSDGYVELNWDEALDLAAAELRRLGAGPNLGEDLPGAQVFGGSYGWASAGRFHHAQSQVHRFLNTVFGGYVGSVDTYSSAAGAVILSTVFGDPVKLTRDHPYLEDLAERAELLLAFGGLPLRNAEISGGGNTQHLLGSAIARATARGCEMVALTPVADDFPGAQARWLAPRPGTDVALMLGMAHRLLETDQVNWAFLGSHCSGRDQFFAYLTGATDGIEKNAAWAAAICGLEAGTIRDLADRAAVSRTLINVTYSLQRAENGEQPIWMALVLACMLPHAGADWLGFSYGLGSIGNIGKLPVDLPLPTFPQGVNRVRDRIPVARIADLLLHPGTDYSYWGKSYRYADIRLVYWAGGNPFHHHQDLIRLRRAFARPDTIIVHDSVGTATAAHADIIFPATITAEREDIGAAGNDPFVLAMEQFAPPYGEARDDYTIFLALAERLGCAEAFGEGLDAAGWLRRIYAPMREALAAHGLAVPDYELFRRGGHIRLPARVSEGRVVRFLADPARAPLATASGRIELFSETVAAAGLPGHPAWIPPTEWLGAELAHQHPFQLVANQPAGRLHSQLDFGSLSASGKSDGREIARMAPADAKRLSLENGCTIRLWNGRGSVLAGLAIDAGVAEGVVQLSTGAWLAAIDLGDWGPTCVNGNPNMLTADRPASIFSQGCSGQLCLVSIEKSKEPVPTRSHATILPKDQTAGSRLVLAYGQADRIAARALEAGYDGANAPM